MDFYGSWYKGWLKKLGDSQEIEGLGGSQNKCSHKDLMKIMQKRTWIQMGSDTFVSNIQCYLS